MTSQPRPDLKLTLSINSKPTESALAAAYLFLEMDGLLPNIWHWRKPPELSEFLALTKRHDSIYYACYVTPDGKGPEIAGLGWAIDIEHLGGDGKNFKCSVGQAFLRKWWSFDIARDLARMCVDDGFDPKNGNLSVMYGWTPVPNPVATRFIGKVGFNKLCTAPLYGSWQGEPCDYVVSAMTRDQWSRREVI